MTISELLGHASAELDPILLKCSVQNHYPFEDKHILTGRWGIGKSAILILKNKRIVEILESVCPEDEDKRKYRLCWYIGEDALEHEILKIIEDEFKDVNQEFLISAFEKLWSLEIFRTYLITLSRLNKNYYGYVSAHWKEIESITVSSKFTLKNIWKDLGIINNILDLNLSELGKPIKISSGDNSSHKIDEEYLEKLILKCLNDLTEKSEIPIIAVEPIETFTSNIENDNSLAQPLINALLNTFHKKFSPSVYNNFNVRLSIPWHRFEKSDTRFPQKIITDVGFVKWTKKGLKEFIDKRIENAFKISGRKFDKHSDPWYELFDKNVSFKLVTPNVEEDSFDYFLRHSHYRPRDLLMLVEYCIDEFILQDEGYRDSVEVFRTVKISGQIIKDAFRKIGEELGKNIIKEGKRRYRYLEALTKSIFGIKVPISRNDFGKIISKTSLTFVEATQALWDCGILGISINTNNDDVRKILESRYSKDLNVHYIQQKQSRWFWFQHLCKEDAIALITNHLNVLESEFPSLEWKFVVHPKMFEVLSIRPVDEVPIGM